MRVAIVDYGMGNLDSVGRAVEECGGRPLVTADPRDLTAAAAVILPGVGAFAKGMQNIRERGLDEILVDDVARNGVPFLGLCLGMQLLATEGSEGDHTPGLGLVRGRVERINVPGLRVPHIGWNEVHQTREHPLFRSIPSGADFYFVHSFVLRCDDPDDVIATVPYGEDIVAGVARGTVAGLQFHPEKSQRMGFQLLRNFLESAERSTEPELTFSAPRG